jgi:hypothetical protein
MKGIAVSVYDKFDDLAILVDIIRENWEDQYYIAVCCKHKDAKTKLSDVDIDCLVRGDNIPYSSVDSSENKRKKKSILLPGF